MSTKNIVTPRGKAIWPKVNEPSTKFDPMGVYTCDIEVSEEDAKAFIEELTPIIDAAYAQELKAQGKNKIKRNDSFPVRQDDEGAWIIKTKQVAKKETRSGKTLEFDVKLFDAKGKPCDVEVGGGSMVKCSVTPRCWYNPSLGFGCTLTLRAVQVIELVEYEPSYGFSEEDGSFQAAEEDLGEGFEDETDGDF
jgi:hypothetical protein